MNIIISVKWERATDVFTTEEFLIDDTMDAWEARQVGLNAISFACVAGADLREILYHGQWVSLGELQRMYPRNDRAKGSETHDDS